MENKIKLIWLTIILLITGCYIPNYLYEDYTPTFEDHPHTTEVYWYTDYELGGTPYFGYWNNFYYYYGVPHFYPWWYYYQFLPPYHYYANTHVIITIENGYYVYKHKGIRKFHNIGPNCSINKGKFTPTIKLKNENDKSIVFPRDWKSSNSTKNTKQDNWWNKVNMNKTDYNRTYTPYGNSNKTNNKHNNTININKNNKINKNIKNNRTSKKPK